MKSAYELAMERLAEQSPDARPLTDDQKAAIAEIDEKYRAKIAEREVFLTGLIAKAQAGGNFAELVELEEQKRREVVGFRERSEEEKEALRKSFTGE